MSAHRATRGDHTLNLRVLRFRGADEQEEPAMLALDLCARGRFDDAIDVCEAALEASPEDPELLLTLGRACLGAGLLSRAQAMLAAAAQADRGWAEPYAWLARALVRAGRMKKAAEVAEKARALGASDRDLETIVEARTRDAALTERLSRFARHPERDEPTLLAVALVEAGRVGDARAIVEQALTRDPDDDDLRVLALRTGAALPSAALSGNVLGLLTGAAHVASDAERTLLGAAPEGADEDDAPADLSSTGEASVIVDPSLGARTVAHARAEYAPDTVVGEPAPRLHAPRRRGGFQPSLGERASAPHAAGGISSNVVSASARPTAPRGTFGRDDRRR